MYVVAHSWNLVLYAGHAEAWVQYDICQHMHLLQHECNLVSMSAHPKGVSARVR